MGNIKKPILVNMNLSDFYIPALFHNLKMNIKIVRSAYQ